METATRTDEQLALVRHLFDCFAARDLVALSAMLAPDVRVRPSIGGAPLLEGREAVVQWWTDYFASDSEIEARPLDFDTRGDCVVVRGYLRHRSGRTLAETTVHWLYEFKDGLVVRMESHPSRAAALAAC